MNAWKYEILRIIQVTMGNPGSRVELVVLLAIGAIVFVMVMTRVGDALDIPVPDAKQSVAVLIVSAAAMLLVIAAVNLYLAPHIASQGLGRCVLIASAVVVLLAIAVPAVYIIQRATYLNGLSSILLSIVAAVIVVVLVRAGFRAVRVGHKGIDKGRSHAEMVNKFLSE